MQTYWQNAMLEIVTKLCSSDYGARAMASTQLLTLAKYIDAMEAGGAADFSTLRKLIGLTSDEVECEDDDCRREVDVSSYELSVLDQMRAAMAEQRNS